MTKLKYVGLKQSEDAFRHLTGHVWGPGIEHDVQPAHAALMLKHPDVFALADAGPAPVIALAPPPPPSGLVPPATPQAPVDAKTLVGGNDLAGTTKLSAGSLDAAAAPGQAIGAGLAIGTADAKPEGLHVIKAAEGWLVLDAMEAPALHKLAAKLDLAKARGKAVSDQMGANKLRAELVRHFGGE